MRDKILELLTAKFAGVRKDGLGHLARSLAVQVANEDEAQALVEKLTEEKVNAFVKEWRADVDREVSEAGKKIEARLNKPAPSQKEGAEGDAGKGEGGDISALIAKAVTAAISPLKDEIAAVKLGRVADTRRQQFAAIVDRLPEAFRAGYRRVNVTDLSDEEFATLLTETNAEVDAIESATNAKGAVLGRPLANTSSKGKGNQSGAVQATEQEAEAVVDRLHI